MTVEITKESLVLWLQASVGSIFRLAADNDGSTTIVLHALQGIDSHLTLQGGNLVAVILLWRSTAERRVCYHHVHILVSKRLRAVLARHILEALSAKVSQSLCINVVHMNCIHRQTNGKHSVAGTWLQCALHFLAVALYVHISQESIGCRGGILLLHHSLGVTLLEAGLVLVEILDSLKLFLCTGCTRCSNISCLTNNSSLCQLLQVGVPHILQATTLSNLPQPNDAVLKSAE